MNTMDNFELNTFSNESSQLDWDRLFDGDALASSQASQQSDYLRNLDLGLDMGEFDFLQEDGGCRGEVKQEPESPLDEVLDLLLYPMCDGTPQQFSPDVSAQQQQQLLQQQPNQPECVKANMNQSEDLLMVLPEIFQLITDGQIDSVDTCSVASTDLAEDEVPSIIDLGSSDAVDSTTNDVEMNYTPIVKPTWNRSIRRARESGLERPPSPLFSDDYLRRVGTKEFNRRINELSISSEESRRWKRRRRTLKNRGYAQNCRQRRVGRHQAADEENMQLRRELAEERAKSVRLRQRIAVLEASLSAARANAMN